MHACHRGLNPIPLFLNNTETLHQDEINGAHEEYMRAIVALFDEHKAGLGYGDRKLTLV